MLTEDWNHIKAVFEAALPMSEPQRTSYIESACPSREHRVIVSELLSDHSSAGRFLQTVTIRVRPVFFSNDLVASRFRIVRLIGQGGMGEVYETFDERLRARVALKTLRLELSSDPQALERFRREILVAREVSHESLCKVFDLIEHAVDGTEVPCLTMQLLEGESLLKYLQAHRPLSTTQALPLIRQIAGAIDVLHANRIVHRDLKPSNIVLTRREDSLHAVVTDFGLARPITHVEGGIFESQKGFQAGAPYFMAPELLRDGRPGPASDIYALGLIIDEMVTQTRAFSAESLHGLYYQRLWERPLSPSARSEQLPPHWDSTILRCLADDPANRYARAADVVADLERSGPTAIPSLAPPTISVTPSESAPPRKLWRLPAIHRGTLIAFLCLLFVAAATVFAAKFLEGPPTTSVVVFPIENAANKPELNYLCKGIAAELMRRLSLIDGVRIVPYYDLRSNTRLNQFKEQFSLSGLLQASGNQVRLTAQLAENSTGALVWSDNFDRDVQNPLQLQSDIAEGSVRALQLGTLFGKPLGVNRAALPAVGPLLNLLGFQRTPVPRAATNSAAAFDYYLRGRSLFEERTAPAALNAIRSYESALREDPGFALAKAALADAQFVLMDYEYEPAATLLARAQHYAEDAVRLGPDVAEAYTALAAVRQTQRDFAGAEQSYKTAIRLNPRFSMAHRWYAGFIIQFERFDETLEEMRRSVELDPYDYSAKSNQGLFLFYAHRYREAIAALNEALSHKDLLAAHISLGDLYTQRALEESGTDAQADFARALQQADLVEHVVRRGMAQSPSPSGARSIKYADRMHAAIYAFSGRPALARPYLERLRADTDAGRVSSFSLAMVYAAQGNAELAIPLLEKAAERKEHQVVFLRVAPQFAPIRSDPRFQSLLRNAGLL